VLRSLDLPSWPSWAAITAYILLWLVAGVLGRSVLRRWLGSFAAHQKTELSEVLAATVPRPAGIAVFLVGLAMGLRFLAVPETRLLEYHRVLAFSLATLGVGLLTRVAARSIDAYGRSNPDLRSSAGLAKAVTWVAALALIAILASDTLGISLAPALAAFGVGSIAVALALQDTLSNFFSGLYIIVDKPIRPGDFVRIDPSYEGFVTSIGWRSTRLKTLSNSVVVIPNGTLSKAIITNYSLPSPHIASSVRVDVPAEADVERVEAALAQVAGGAGDIPGIAPEPAPSVALSPGFVDGCIAFSINYQVLSFSEQFRVQHALRKRIATRFKLEGIPLRRAPEPR
jgi:small-conductance mechanosensitive channel